MEQSVVCTRATPRLNVRQANHLTEKASSSLRSWVSKGAHFGVGHWYSRLT